MDHGNDKNTKDKDEARKKRNEKRRLRRLGKETGLDWIDPEAGTRQVRGEQAIWRAVILQMLEDATCHSRKQQDVHNREQALHWLNSSSHDFQMVCDFAGLNPDYVRKQVKKALLNQCQWRKNPAKPKVSELTDSESKTSAEVLNFPLIYKKSA